MPLDSKRLDFLDPVLRMLSKKPGDESLFGYDYPSFTKVFQTAARRIGLKLVPYLCRHSGASIDRSKKLRSQEEVQKRGRWSQLASVRRYEKHGRLNETWKSLSDAQRLYFETCADELENALLHGRLPSPMLVQ